MRLSNHGGRTDRKSRLTSFVERDVPSQLDRDFLALSLPKKGVYAPWTGYWLDHALDVLSLPWSHYLWRTYQISQTHLIDRKDNLSLPLLCGNFILELVLDDFLDLSDKLVLLLVLLFDSISKLLQSDVCLILWIQNIRRINNWSQLNAPYSDQR